MDEELNKAEGSNKKLIIAAVAALVFLIIAIALFFFLRSDNSTAVSLRSNFFGGTADPDDTRPALPGPGVGEPGNFGTDPSTSDKPFFRQLSTIPTAGSFFYTSSDGKRYMRYVAKENGHVYDVNVDTAESRKISNTTIPRVHEALFGDNGNVVAIRALESDIYTKRDVIKTFFGRLNLPTDMANPDSVGTITGNYLKDGVTAISISPDGKKLFYLLPTNDEFVVGNTIDIATGEPREVFRHQFREWLPQILNDGKIVLTTKPSSRVPGFSYLYNPSNGDMQRLVREKNGLVTQPDSKAEHMLFSENIAANAVLSVHGTFGGDEGAVLENVPLSLTTLAEKCAWTSDDSHIFCAVYSAVDRKELPDEWYKGSFFFEDSFWSVDMATREPMLIADPSLMKTGPFDATALSVPNDRSAVFFINKRDETLWMLGIPKPKDAIIDAATEEELRDIEGSGGVGRVSTTTP